MVAAGRNAQDSPEGGLPLGKLASRHSNAITEVAPPTRAGWIRSDFLTRLNDGAEIPAGSDHGTWWLPCDGIVDSQVTVFATCAGSAGHALVDRELYLPEQT